MIAGRWVGVLGGLVIGAQASVALAQTRDSATAEALFQQGRKLAEQGNYAEACPLFAESNRLDPGVGILLYMGACYERVGKVASAWAAFREARDGAQASGSADRVATAEERIAALEPRLPRLRITVGPDASIAGLEVLRDDVLLGDAAWGTAYPIDPGTHRVEARAAGYETWTGNVEIKDGASATLDVPPLRLLKEPAETPAPPLAPVAQPPAPASLPVPTDDGSTMRTGAFVAWGIGGASLVAGSIFGLLASSGWDDAQTHCRAGTTPLRCDAKGLDAIDTVETQGLLSTVFFVGAGAGLAAGGVFWWLAPDGGSSAVGLRTTGTDVTVMGVF